MFPNVPTLLMFLHLNGSWFVLFANRLRVCKVNRFFSYSWLYKERKQGHFGRRCVNYQDNQQGTGMLILYSSSSSWQSYCRISIYKAMMNWNRMVGKDERIALILSFTLPRWRKLMKRGSIIDHKIDIYSFSVP